MVISRLLGFLASFTEQKWLPAACLITISAWTLFFVFLALAPMAIPIQGEAGRVLESMRMFCLGWDPRTGTYKVSQLLGVVLPAPFLMGLVAILWPAEVLGMARRTWRAVTSRRGAVILTAIGLVAAGGLFAAGRARTVPVLPEAVRETAPAFELVDSSGLPVALNDYRGKVVLLTFTYSHCQEVCPTIVQRVDKAIEEARIQGLQALSVTVDPDRDTPERLRLAVRGWRVHEGNWRFLTGDPDVVFDVLQRYAVGRKKDPVTGMVAHTNALVLIDRQGRVAGRVNPLTTGISEMAAMIRRVGG